MKLPTAFILLFLSLTNASSLSEKSSGFAVELEEGILAPVLLSQHPEMTAEWQLAKAECKDDKELLSRANDIRAEFDLWEPKRQQALNALCSVSEMRKVIASWTPEDDLSALALTSTCWIDPVHKELERRFCWSGKVDWLTLFYVLMEQEPEQRSALLRFLADKWPKEAEGPNSVFLSQALVALKKLVANPDSFVCSEMPYPPGHLNLYQCLGAVGAILCTQIPYTVFLHETAETIKSHHVIFPSLLEVKELLESGNDEVAASLMSFREWAPLGTGSLVPVQGRCQHLDFDGAILLAIHMAKEEDTEALLIYLHDLIENSDDMFFQRDLVKAMLHSRLCTRDIMAIVANRMDSEAVYSNPSRTLEIMSLQTEMDDEVLLAELLEED